MKVGLNASRCVYKVASCPGTPPPPASAVRARLSGEGEDEDEDEELLELDAPLPVPPRLAERRMVHTIQESKSHRDCAVRLYKYTPPRHPKGGL